MAAMAEALWSPKGNKAWDSFSARLPEQLRRYDNLGYQYAHSAYMAMCAIEPDTVLRGARVSLTTEIPVEEIRYTLDGSTPSTSSTMYNGPFTLTKSATVTAVGFTRGVPQSAPTTQSYLAHLGSFAPVRLTAPYSPRYVAGGSFALTDGLRGSTRFNDGRWQGYLGDDLDAIFALKETTTVRTISCGFLDDPDKFIYYPPSVEMSTSLDGVTWTPAGTVHPDLTQPGRGITARDVTVELPGTPVRFVRIHAQNVRRVPQGSRGEGEPAWIFTDECVIQ
jgi:hexosaminidase